jgi:hypothetical protein
MPRPKLQGTTTLEADEKREPLNNLKLQNRIVRAILALSHTQLTQPCFR